VTRLEAQIARAEAEVAWLRSTLAETRWVRRVAKKGIMATKHAFEISETTDLADSGDEEETRPGKDDDVPDRVHSDVVILHRNDDDDDDDDRVPDVTDFREAGVGDNMDKETTGADILFEERMVTESTANSHQDVEVEESTNVRVKEDRIENGRIKEDRIENCLVQEDWAKNGHATDDEEELAFVPAMLGDATTIGCQC
jgi:hypothetical protein